MYYWIFCKEDKTKRHYSAIFCDNLSVRISILLFKPRLRISFYGLPTIEWDFYILGITHNISNGFSIFRVIMDKRIENAMNELINTEIWATGLYLSLQVYFEDERLPILSSWLNSQAQDNMNKVYQMMNRICHDGGCVAINEMKRDTHEWTTPLNALNELLEHEQYISCQVNTFLILCRNVNMSFHSFISGLYADRIYVSTVFMELLRILAKENERRLPYF